MDTERLDLTIDELLLDVENPRIGSVETQSEALASVVRLDARHFRTMMQSIKTNGLDPGDSFYVISDEDDETSYVVVDGNRRLAALKVLVNPALLKGTDLAESIINPLLKAAEGFDGSATKDLSCVRFADRSDANEWIVRRHGRGMEGEGRIPWGTLETQRFQKDRTILDIIEFVGRNSTYDNEEWQRIKGKIEANPTIVRRFIDSKAGREWLGVSVVEQNDGRKVPFFSKSASFVLGVLSRFFLDIANDKVDTRKYNKASDISDYFSELPPDLHSNATTAPQEFSSAEVKDDPQRPRQAAPASSQPKPKTSKSAPLRKTLAPPRHQFAQPKSEKSIQLLREASRVSLKDTPLSCAFILRAFIQQTIDCYMKDSNIPFWENNVQLDLAVRAERVFDHLITNKHTTAKEIGAIRRMFAKGSDPASIKALNDYHHDTYQVPSMDVLRNAWDSCVGLFIVVHGKA